MTWRQRWRSRRPASREAGLYQPQSGTILLDGQPIAARANWKDILRLLRWAPMWFGRLLGPRKAHTNSALG
ncbi:hypothetical protein KCP71_15355 [Salmonella enterica subsp. enterica]|nr:hypothetical protein KCP71_15355 [Salmonella enterica subsp. enterica]